MRAINCQPTPKFKRETKPQNSTETALFYTVCCTLFFIYFHFFIEIVCGIKKDDYICIRLITIKNTTI